MLGFLIALGCGFATPYLQTPLGEPVANALREHMEIEIGEVRVIAFILAMLIAAILSALFDSGSPFTIILGGAIGYFALRASAVLRKVVENRPED